METNQNKNLQNILAMKNLFEMLGWIVENHTNNILLYKLGVNKHSGAFFVSQSLRVEQNNKLIGYKFMKKMFVITLRSYSFDKIKNALKMLDDLMEGARQKDNEDGSETNNVLNLVGTIGLDDFTMKEFKEEEDRKEIKYWVDKIEETSDRKAIVKLKADLKHVYGINYSKGSLRKCTKCGKLLSSNNSLKRHMSRCHKM